MSMYGPKQSGTRILYVDDDEDALEIVSRMIRCMDMNIELDIAQSSEEAIQKAMMDTYDLYLFDYKLDAFNGIELLEKLSSTLLDEKTHTLKPVIMLTGSEDQKVMREAFQVGMSDFLIKENVTSTLLKHSIVNCLEKYHQRVSSTPTSH